MAVKVRSGSQWVTVTESGLGGIIPIGGIIMWSGAISTIPTGWALCNGTNGTPDLRDRFVIGASSDSPSPSSTTITGTGTKLGGSKDSVVVSHTHGISDPGHAHLYVDVYGVLSSARYGSEAQPLHYTNTSEVRATDTRGTGISIIPEGGSGSNQNIPPYYSLAYIMRVS